MYQSTRLFLATTMVASLIAPVSVFAQDASSTATTTATSTIATSSTISSSTTTPTNIAALLAQINVLRTQLAVLVKQVIDLGGYASTTEPYHEDKQATSTVSARVCLPFTRSMSLGMRGNDIKAVQQVLVTLDSTFPKDAVTGFFGPKTRDAIKRLQQKSGVVVPNGFIGTTTAQMINRFCSGVSSQSTGTGTSSISNATSSSDTPKIDR